MRFHALYLFKMVSYGSSLSQESSVQCNILGILGIDFDETIAIFSCLISFYATLIH